MNTRSLHSAEIEAPQVRYYLLGPESFTQMGKLATAHNTSRSAISLPVLRGSCNLRRFPALPFPVSHLEIRGRLAS